MSVYGTFEPSKGQTTHGGITPDNRHSRSERYHTAGIEGEADLAGPCPDRRLLTHLRHSASALESHSASATMLTLGGGMAGDIEQWLEALDLAKYQRAFAENEIAFGDLSELTDSDLKEMGLPIGPRRRVLKAIAELRVQRHPPPDASSAEIAEQSQVRPAGTPPTSSRSRPTSRCCPCRPDRRSSTRWKTSGSSCATTGSPTGSSRPTTTSSP